MKIIDLFSGVGGLSLGFEDAGFTTVASVDLWDDAIETFNHNRSTKVGCVMDIKDFNDTVLPQILKENKITGVIGGPPCQGYSSARLSDKSERIDGINEDRNQLYLEFFRTVKMAKPEFFMLENVRGMVSLNDGAFVKDILKRFGQLGYSIDYRVLNAADFGVPQNRFRVFFVGFMNGPFQFPQSKDEFVNTESAISDLPLEPLVGPQKYSVNPKNAFQKEIRRGSKVILNHEPTNHSSQTIEIISMIPDGGSIKSIDPSYWTIRKYNKAFQRMDSKKPSHTIDTGHRNYFHYKANRIPTVRESARIQSFPDWFEFKGSKTSQFKQVGNAVPPRLAYELALQIAKFLP
jgi:DNA (cytosine-5)-methyltransferase 1